MDKINRLSAEQLERYRSSPPLALDEEIRRQFGIPDDRYYVVSLWPECVAGVVTVDKRRYRVVGVKKISKSDEP